MTFNALLTAALRFQRRHILGRTVAVAVGLVMVVATLELQGALTRGVAQAPADLGPATSVIVRSPASFGIFGEAQRPGLPVETIESVAGVAGVERAEGDIGHLQVITSDGRAYERVFEVEVGQEVRITASTTANLLFSIEHIIALLRDEEVEPSWY